MVRMFQQWTSTLGVSSCVLFIDVVGAFDAVVREQLFEQEVLDSDVAGMLRRLGFGPQVTDELVRHIQQSAYLRDSGLSTHAFELMQESHLGNWFSTSGLEE
eukprot:14973826-Alexandrium_andersonii.AAC.1